MSADGVGGGSTFQLAGMPLLGQADLFGVWSTTSARQERMSGTPTHDERLVWRVDWTGEDGRDLATLRAASAVLAGSAQAVAAAGSRLGAAVSGLDEPTYAAAGGPEAALAALLAEAASVQPATEMSYGLPSPRATLGRIGEEFESVLQTAGRMLAYPAWVESSVAGQPAGRTIVTWAGEQISVWSAAAADEHIHAQQRALDLAISSRATFIRMVGVATRGAGLLMTASTPLGPVLAFPAAWRFVDAVVHEITVKSKRR